MTNEQISQAALLLRDISDLDCEILATERHIEAATDRLEKCQADLAQKRAALEAIKLGGA